VADHALRERTDYPQAFLVRIDQSHFVQIQDWIPGDQTFDQFTGVGAAARR
jgi:hypothetical protein